VKRKDGDLENSKVMWRALETQVTIDF